MTLPRSDQLAWGSHAHDKIPREVATGRILDITKRHLGHPDDPGLWDRLHGHCQVGTLECANCPEASPMRFLYLRVQHDQRQVCAYGPREVAAAGYLETPEHLALKDMISRLAEERGLTAEQESRARSNARVTDVVVSGGDQPVGWEVQLSAIRPTQVRRRIDVAVNDGLAPSWLSMQHLTVWKTLVDRAPATTLRSMGVTEIRFAQDPRIMMGIKRISLVACDSDHRRQLWHRDLKCTGRHGQPALYPPEKHPTLGKLVELTATKTVVPFQWPRTVRGYRRPWLLVPASDVDAFLDAERPYLNLHRIDARPTRDRFPPRPGRDSLHFVDETPRDEHHDQRYPTHRPDMPGFDPWCPECGWSRGLHRPSIRIGMIDDPGCSRATKLTAPYGTLGDRS